MGLTGLYKDNMEFDLAFRKTSFPFSWNLFYQSAGFNINTGQSYYLTEINSSLSSGDYKMGFSYEKNLSLKDKSSDTYSIDAKPDYYNIGFNIKNKSERLPVTLGISKTSLTMKTHLLMDELPFSSINISDLSLFRINSDIYFSDAFIPLNLSISYNYFQGHLSGDVQSWPFDDIIQSLFVNRLNFKAEGSVKLIEGSLASKFVYKNLVVKPLVNFYYISPDLSIQYWQPVYLVFGIKDYNESNDGINYMLLGRAGCSADIDVGIAVISLNINQFFPLVIKKDNQNNVISTSPSPSISSPSTDTISGGTFFTLAIKKAF